jgi:SAM-dependent methyltransferase
MAVEQSSPYVLGGTQTEQQRLLTQAEDYKPRARSLLADIKIQPGWRVIDMGCGPIGILDLLSESVGPEGEVLGLEREARFAEMARLEVAERGLRNVKIVQADALHSGLEKNSFDLVHERLLMINLSARDALVSEMVTLTRPGGTVVLEDVDNVSWLCEPAHPSWNVLLDTFHTVHKAGGGDGFIGRRLPNYLRTVGLSNVQTNVHVEAIGLGQYRRTHLVSLIDSIRDKVTAMRLLTERQLNDHMDALLKHLENPDTTVIDKLLVQAWGQKRV